MEATSIYPIHQIYFQCDGCKAQWMIWADPPIRNIDDFKAFMSDPGRMEPCPRNCGARTCSLAFRAGPATSSEGADPFCAFKPPPGGTEGGAP
jgi:hypothetical protein